LLVLLLRPAAAYWNFIQDGSFADIPAPPSNIDLTGWKAVGYTSGSKILPHNWALKIKNMAYNAFDENSYIPSRTFLKMNDEAVVYQYFSTENARHFEIFVRFVAKCSGDSLPFYVRLGVEHEDGTFSEFDTDITSSNWKQYTALVCIVQSPALRSSLTLL
jgi:hypothetical protein